MMGGEEELLAIRPPDGSVIRLAQLGRASADGVEDGLNIGPRACNDARDLAGRPLLLLPLPQFAGEPADLCSAHGFWRTAPLWRHRFVALRFGSFAACSGAPSHRLPQGSGQDIVAGQARGK
jgi:hypothetical protein